MSNFLVALAITFGIILFVELPDKTLVATLVLALRFRPRPVVAGVAVAFAVQCAIAVTAGGLLHLLPHRLLEAAIAVLFAVGAVLLIVESRKPDDEFVQRQEQSQVPAWRVALTSFGVLFVAEWGDASQLATAGLVARFGEPLAVGLGAWCALVGVAALAASVGRLIVGRIPLRVVHLAAGAMFAAFAGVAVVAAIG